MSIAIFNIIVSASVIAFVSWLSGRFPGTAGFIIALPIATMLVLPLSHLQHGGECENTILLAKSIFVAVPVTLAFFVPFLLSGKLGLSFWHAYAFGCLALVLGFFAHRAIIGAAWLSGS